MNKTTCTIISILSSFLLCVTTYAETDLTCPSIQSVRQLKNIWPQGYWLPLYVSNDELASLADIETFSKTAQQLNRAEWSGNFLEMAHCHYAGNDKVMLARNMLRPNPSQYPLWVFDSGGKLARCFSASEDNCPYGGIG